MPAPKSDRAGGWRQHAAAVLFPRTAIERIAIELARFVRKGFARVYEFAPTQLNLSWVTEQLAVGGAFRRSQIPRLKAMGVQGIIDCREEALDDAAALEAAGIEYLRLPTTDATALTQHALDAGVAWARERLARGDKVLVHCQHGVGRAPLLASCILVDGGLNPVDAVELVKRRRWQASPNEEQLNALLEFAERRNATGADSSSPG